MRNRITKTLELFIAHGVVSASHCDKWAVTKTTGTVMQYITYGHVAVALIVVFFHNLA